MSQNLVEANIGQSPIKRPSFITFLSYLLIVVGIIFIVQAFLSPSKSFGELGFSPLGSKVLIIFGSVLGVIAGIGMLMNKFWGWWLSSFFYALAIIRNIKSILFIPTTLKQQGIKEYADLVGQKYYAQIGLTLFVAILLFLYFILNREVLQFFEIKPNTKIKAAIILIVLAIGVAGIFSVIP
jgi:hypothetical protein